MMTMKMMFKMNMRELAIIEEIERGDTIVARIRFRRETGEQKSDGSCEESKGKGAGEPLRHQVQKYNAASVRRMYKQCVKKSKP